MACPKDFENAGKKPGLMVWRVEKMALKEIPQELHGIFYTGDAYILLNTFGGPSYHAHMWLGAECSRDEKVAASIFLVQLDDCLQGRPIQFREVQGNESVGFLGYFKPGITYKSGGVASGFKQVVTNDMDVKRLLHVTGRRAPRATEVPLSWDSFNKKDCFIIDLGQDIYAWQGEECNRFEAVKAAKIAIGIRDHERGGRAKFQIVEEGSEPDDVIDVLGAKPDIPSEGADDDAIDMANKNNASLYMISDAAGSMKTTVVAEKNPFTQKMLSHKECYILDNGVNNKIFVWKGPDANPSERSAAFKAAVEFLEEKNYPDKTQIQVMPAFAETPLFKQFFSDWRDKDETITPGPACMFGRIAKVEQVPFDASTLHDNSTMAVHHGMVDDGSGDVQVWRVDGGDKVSVEPSSHGQFYGGDCYLVLYSYRPGGRERHIIYTWQGLKCTQDELAASAILTMRLDDSMSGSPVQVRVTQGQEPAHLVSLFKKQPMIVYLGGTSREGGQTTAGTTRLFHIRRSSTKATRAVEVESSAGFLNTNDVFVLKSPESLFVWRGVGSTEEETAAATYVTKLLGGNVTEVDEGKEPAGFWSVLGGKKDYQTSKSLQTVKPPRLFGCSNKTGNLTVEEVPGEFTQVDMATDDIMILDANDQIFLWIGNDSNDVEKTGAAKIAKDYVDSDPAGRRGVPIATIKQGSEPPTFTGWFHAWDPKMWETDPLAAIRDSN